MKTLKYFIVTLLTVSMSACTDFMQPEKDGALTQEYVLNSRTHFIGTLYQAYMGLPNRVNFNYEAATDNAVTNLDNTASSNGARNLSALSNPFGDVWESNYKYINIVNGFLSHMILDKTKPISTPIKFDNDSTINIQTYKFLLGEAYFLRAWYEFDLLKKYGGVASDGKSYGFIIDNKVLSISDNLDLPRNSYYDCAQQISNDCDSARKYLPLVFSAASGAKADGLATDNGHASGIAALALKARTWLYAASPAYNTTGTNLWPKAAQTAADAIVASGGAIDLMSFDDYHNRANMNDAIYNNADCFFRSTINSGTSYESQNYPPRAFNADGLVNPTQNLVDAFPMSDGYPKGTSPTASIKIDPTNVATNRDPRLDKIIARNGETFANVLLDTKSGGLDAYGSSLYATRTGYYLQKLLDQAVSLEPLKVVNKSYSNILLGKPELYLNFAEAVINATGNPDDNTYGITARAILAKVRNKGLGSGNDKYLSTVNGKDAFLGLVKNERRLELCFEDYRFWDVRRWCTSATDLTVLNAPVYGIYSTNAVESRNYKSPYMPLPNSELLKTNNLQNNIGW